MVNPTVYKSSLFFAIIMTCSVDHLYGAHKSAFTPYIKSSPSSRLLPAPAPAPNPFSSSSTHFNPIERLESFMAMNPLQIYTLLVQAIQSKEPLENIQKLLRASPIPPHVLLNEKFASSIKNTPLGAALCACQNNPRYIAVVDYLLQSGAIFTQDVDEDTGHNYLSLLIEHYYDIQDSRSKESHFWHYIMQVCAQYPGLLYTPFFSGIFPLHLKNSEILCLNYADYALTPLLYAECALASGNHFFAPLVALLTSYHSSNDSSVEPTLQKCTAHHIRRNVLLTTIKELCSEK